ALNKPMVGVSSLAAMARIVQLVHPDARRAVCLLDARMNEIYWAAYDILPDLIKPAVEPNLIAKPDLEQILSTTIPEETVQTVIAGDAVQLLNVCADVNGCIVFNTSISPHANAIADLAARDWQMGKSCVAKDFQLTYLRNSVSWNKRQRIRS